jgi:hypothetical protein
MTSQMNAESFHTLLRTHEPPWLLAVSGTDEEAIIWTDALLKGGFESRFVRGQKMVQTQGFFDEFAAALQFPHFCEGGWDSFAECLRMLGTLPTTPPAVLLVLNSNRLLDSEPPRELQIALHEFVGTARSSTVPNYSPSVGPQAVHFVFQATPAEYPTLIERFRSVGCELTPVDDEAWKPLR